MSTVVNSKTDNNQAKSRNTDLSKETSETSTQESEIDVIVENSENQMSLDQALHSDSITGVEMVTKKQVTTLVSGYFNPERSFFVKFDSSNMGETLVNLAQDQRKSKLLSKRMLNQ
jgi:hypothetical protein